MTKCEPLRRTLDGEPLWLTQCENHEIAELLLAVGADVDSRNHEGMTPLHLAARDGHAHLVQLLIDHGANLSTADGEGCTPYTLGQVRRPTYSIHPCSSRSTGKLNK